VLIFASVAIGVLVSSRAVVGQGGGASRVPVSTAQVPSVSVPSIAVPRVPQQGGQQPVQPAKYLEPQRIEQLAQAVRMGVDYLPGEVIVKFKPGMAPVDQNRALATMASHPTSDTIEWHSDFAIVRDASQPDAYILAQRLRSQPEVEYAEPNFFVRLDPLERRFSTPPPTSLPAPARRTTTGSFGRVSGVPNDTDYAAFQWNFSLLSMPSAWDLQPGGTPDLIVAVIDSGITVAAANLVYPVWTGSSFQTLTMAAAVNTDLPASRLTLAKDYIGTRISPAAPIADLDGHGTHVSGTIAQATNNGFLVSGIAYNVRIMPVKVCAQYWDLMIRRGLTGTPGFEPLVDGTCSNADVADGVRYAVDQGARVVNISLGGGSPSTTLQNALQYAVSKGAFVAVAMGNEFAEGDPIQYPAAYAPGIDGVMSVAAVGVNSTHASYSSSGQYCEIAAPGGDLEVARVDKGVIWQSTLNPNNVSTSLTVPRFDVYTKVGYTGTSMATPHVAGLAALLMSQQPKLTGAQVEQIIKASALDIGTPGKDTLTGFGLIQPRKALFGQSINSK
jgi:serine protease